MEKRELTENQIDNSIKDLERLAESGELTVSEAMRLMKLREEKRIIEKARWDK